MDWTWYLFRFDGRINRAKLWLAGLVMLSGMIFLVALTIGIIALLSGKPPAQFGTGLRDVFKLFNPATYRSFSWADLPALVSKTVGSTLCLWVYLATSIKRLHDRDKRGWWIIPFVVLPGSYNTLSGWWPEDSYPDMLHGLIAFIAYIWGFIEMYCLKGSRKTNRFGADPLTPPPPRDTRPPWDQQSEIEMVPHKAGPPPVWHVKPGYE
jgi:uncharacterized membrane protein YhaH (DUF805 family)